MQERRLAGKVGVTVESYTRGEKLEQGAFVHLGRILARDGKAHGKMLRCGIAGQQGKADPQSITREERGTALG